MDAERTLRWFRRRFEVPTSATAERARELVDGLPEKLPTLFPSASQLPSDVGFEDTPPRPAPWRAARDEGDQFFVGSGGWGPWLGVQGRIEPAPHGCVVHVELGVEGPLPWMVVAAMPALVLVSLVHSDRLVTGLAVALLQTAIAVAAGWLLVRHIDAMERAVRALFPPPESPREGPFR